MGVAFILETVPFLLKERGNTLMDSTSYHTDLLIFMANKGRGEGRYCAINYS